jgi:hypothetical protein
MASIQYARADNRAPTARLDEFLAERRPLTPCVVVDLDIVRARYAALRNLRYYGATPCNRI